MNLPTDLSLSLVSHTNVGKTTLARTLLGRDIGEVRDAAHVTETVEPQVMIDSPAGDRLLLWDTPGFGDSQRLARRLAQAGSPLGWVMTEVWDRWRDRAFWASQRTIRHVLEQADVALYLVNAAEAPEDAAYLAPELQVLALLGKPVIVLLNQLGEPGTPADEAAQLQRWQTHLAGLSPALAGTLAARSAARSVATSAAASAAMLAAAPGAAVETMTGAEVGATPGFPSAGALVRAVLPLDAFTRCWVQEALLLQAVAEALPAERRPAMDRLAAAWRQHQRSTFDAAMQALAERLARAALDREPVAAGGWRTPLRQAGQRLGQLFGRAADASDSPQALAMAALADRLDADIRRSTATLIRLHRLHGDATGEVLARLARHFARREPVNEGRAALWGGLVTGALAGLKADLVSGGLTMGGGLLAGGVLGALSAAGAARGVNRIRGLAQPLLAWNEAVLDALLRSALLAYLAVAHHGRGRGEWRQGDPPAAWLAAVDTALAERAADRQAWWQQRATLLSAAPPLRQTLADDEGRPVPVQPPVSVEPPPDFSAATAALMDDLGRTVLRSLYPDAAALAGL